jgi:hypothetical protein
MDKQVKFFFEVQPAFLNRGIFLLKKAGIPFFPNAPTVLRKIFVLENF